MSDVTRDEALREFLSYPCPVCGDKTAAETGCPMKGGRPCLMQEAQAALEADRQRAVDEGALVERVQKALRDTWSDCNTGYYPSVGQMETMARAALAAVKGTSDA